MNGLGRTASRRHARTYTYMYRYTYGADGRTYLGQTHHFPCPSREGRALVGRQGTWKEVSQASQARRRWRRSRRLQASQGGSISARMERLLWGWRVELNGWLVTGLCWVGWWRGARSTSRYTPRRHRQPRAVLAEHRPGRGEGERLEVLVCHPHVEPELEVPFLLDRVGAVHEARVGLPVFYDVAEEDGAQALGLWGQGGGWVLYRRERKHRNGLLREQDGRRRTETDGPARRSARRRARGRQCNPGPGEGC